MLFVNDIKDNDFVMDPDEFSFVAMTSDELGFIEDFDDDSYEYSLLSLLDDPSFDVHKVTAIRYLRNFCIDRV